MPFDLSPVIAATAQWLIRAYPASGSAVTRVLAEVQTRQATKVAAWLRYPTSADAGLLVMAGPGGAARLDWLVGADTMVRSDEDCAWRTWVDEVVASWAACLLAEPALASVAVAALDGCEHISGLHYDFRRLTAPERHDRQACALRHPDLLAPVADLHRPALVALLGADGTGGAGTVDAA